MKKDKTKPIRIEVGEAHPQDKTCYYVRTSGDAMNAGWEFYCTLPDLI